jgi:phosphoglycolate phosphatase
MTKVPGNQHMTPSWPRAILFDFDGTLADSYAAITASVNHVRASHRLPPLAQSEVRSHVGRGANYLLEHTVPGGDVETDLRCYREHHPSVLKSGTQLLPGAAQTLFALKHAGKQLAVCSNKPVLFTVELLKILGLEGVFSAVLGPEDVSRSKPAPDMLTAALSRLGVQPGEALYIGDMTVDIETARGAGVAVWVVPTGSNSRADLEKGAPDRVLCDLAELQCLVLAGGEN